MHAAGPNTEGREEAQPMSKQDSNDETETATPLAPGVSLADLTDSSTPVYWFDGWAGQQSCVVRVGACPRGSIHAGLAAQTELARVLSDEGSPVDLAPTGVWRSDELSAVVLGGLLFDAVALATLRPTTARLVVTMTTKGFDTPAMVGLDEHGEPFFLLAPIDIPEARSFGEAAQP